MLKQSPEYIPNWVLPRRPMTAQQIAAATGYSIYFIRELRKSGRLRSLLGKKPYRFDSVHVFETLFKSSEPQAVISPLAELSSLKTESESSRDCKPVKRKDLWS